MSDDKRQGTLYWITGISGAGKTSIGKRLHEYLSNGRTPVFLDSYIMRRIFGDDVGYTRDDRRKIAFKYSKLCYILTE